MKYLKLFLLLLAFTENVSTDNYLASSYTAGKNDGITFYRPYKLILELRKKDTFIRHCGGAQLSAEWYLTAAECLDRSKYDSVRMLRFDKYHDVKAAEMIWLDQKVHPEYSEKTKDNNIALLKGYFYGTPYNIPRLPSRSFRLRTFAKDPAVVLGWKNWPNSERLTMTILNTTVINAFWCKLAYPSRFKHGQHLCASTVRGQGLSQEDVGAPLIITYSDKAKELIGIATDIRPFTNIVPMPMVFTSVSLYVDWIRSEMNKTISKSP